jgi:hypothetical protein
MRIRITLAASCVFMFPAIIFAEASETKAAKSDVAQRSLPASKAVRGGFILRQDLFDRNNPNNLRSNWPSPPAQPGQF